ncbi:MAG: DUF2791 family P-loop domain-containing protein [Actinomycetota bacterium]|nr:DUF2791 family P-loop domain-containing protein [Actinomycetota bacterium]
MTAEMRPDEWLGFIRREYLDEFVKAGGASIKFVVPHDEQAGLTILDGLNRAAEEQGYLVAGVSAAETRAHMMDQLFFRVADQIPWERLAILVLGELARSAGYTVPVLDGAPFVGALARANDLDAGFLRGELRREVSKAVFMRSTLAKDFRVAMTQLCLAQLSGGPDGATTTEVITDWLTGKVKTVGAVKPYNIFTRINRANARYVFESMLDWIRFAGCPGLVARLDLARITVAKNPRDGLTYYTKTSRLDAYELLRQFIDSTDRLDGFLLVVVPAPQFLDDSSAGRGVGEYQALKFRVYDEIRDTKLVNPMSSLVRVSSAAPVAVPT